MVEQRVLKRRLHTHSDVYIFYTRQRLEWIYGSPGSYSKEVVIEFYASYVALS